MESPPPLATVPPIRVNPSLETFRSWLAHKDVVGLDIETSGLERRSKVKCLQVADGGRAFVFTRRIPRMLHELFSSGVGRVAVHNTTYDLREIALLLEHEYPDCIAGPIMKAAYDKVEDTMTMAQVLYGGLLYQFNLAAMIKRHCPSLAYGDEAMLRLYQRTTGSGKVPPATKMGAFKAQIPTETWEEDPDALAYAACDAVATWTLYHIFHEMAEGTEVERIFKVERRLLPTVVRLNTGALPIHPGRLARVVSRLQADIARGEVESVNRFGVLVSHPTRLQELAVEGVSEDPALEDVLGRTPTGKLKCDTESLEAAEAHGWAPAALASELKQLKKRLQLMHSFEKFSHREGRRLMLPATYKPCGASATGRWSASDPALQQVPRGEEYRRVVKARKGWKLVVADYSTMEPRVAAKLSRDEGMRRAIMDGDLYTTAAQSIDGPGGVSPERRQQLKNFFMSYLFGAGGAMLASQASMTVAEALATRASLDGMFPEFASWRREVMDAGPSHSVDGYPMDPGPGGAYKVVAWSVQGHAAYLMKRALVKFYRSYPEYHHYLVCVVHDEAVLHIPEKRASAAALALTKSMRYQDWILMPAEAKITDDWGQAK